MASIAHMSLQTTAEKNLNDTLRLALQHAAPSRALIVYDQRSEGSRLLTAALQAILPGETAMDFDKVQPQEILDAINGLKPGDAVLLVQSANFRLNEFRLRLELFNRGLKTMELGHLERVSSEQLATYVDALAYDPDYYRPLGQALNERLSRAKRIRVLCQGTVLEYASAMEPAKLNVGDYRTMKNVGGTFPIGEIFTEPIDLTATNGEVMLCAFGDLEHHVATPKPFKAIVRNGILTAPEAPAEFQKILALIEAQEPVFVREFGLGLNRAMDKNHVVGDITAFERMNGLHLSLGSKHGVYRKPGLSPKKTRYHIDVFVDAETIEADGEVIFSHGRYLPSLSL